MLAKHSQRSLKINLKNQIIFKKIETTQLLLQYFSQNPPSLIRGEIFISVSGAKVLAQNDFILYFFDALFAQENFALEVIISSLTRQVFFLISAQWDMQLMFVLLNFSKRISTVDRFMKQSQMFKLIKKKIIWKFSNSFHSD